MTNITLLEQFRSFYHKNYPNDMITLITYFSVFGGLGLSIDTTQDLKFLLKKIVLNNFKELHKHIDHLTMNNNEYKRLLKALAVGDRKIFSAFNKAGLNNGNGGNALKYLQEKGLIQVEFSREKDPRDEYKNKKLKRADARHRISNKVLFVYPFIRFWFYFISPHVKDIKRGDFEKLFETFDEKITSYTSLVFEELSEILLNYHLRDSQIESSGSYWDANIEIDILTVTDDEKVYVGECKWTNHQVNKKELHKLREKCERLDIEPTQIIFFSKRGFSKELEQNQGKELALYSSNDFEALVKNAKENELIKELIN